MDDVTDNEILEEALELPKDLLKKLSYNQKLIIETLAKKPSGVLSRRLSHVTGISNKSDAVSGKVRALLAKHEYEIHTKRVASQWLWVLRRIKTEE